jgi:hypothetical protein
MAMSFRPYDEGKPSLHKRHGSKTPAEVLDELLSQANTITVLCDCLDSSRLVSEEMARPPAASRRST